MKKLFKRFVNFFTKWFKEYEIEDATTFGDVKCIQVSNETIEKRKAILFGYNEYVNTANLGSEVGISIRSLMKESYEELISKPEFKIKTIRIACYNGNILYHQNLDFRTINANGAIATRRYLAGHSMSVYQYQENIIDIDCLKGREINGNTSVEMNIAPSCTLTLSIFELKTKKVDYFEYKQHLKEINSKNKLIAFQSTPLLKVSLFNQLINKVKRLFKKISNDIRK